MPALGRDPSRTIGVCAQEKEAWVKQGETEMDQGGSPPLWLQIPGPGTPGGST